MTRKGVLTIFGQLPLPSVKIAGPDTQVPFDLSSALAAGLQQSERFKFEFARILSSGLIRTMWEKFIPIKDEVRRELYWSRLLIEVEYLYDELLKYHEKHPDIPK